MKTIGEVLGRLEPGKKTPPRATPAGAVVEPAPGSGSTDRTNPPSAGEAASARSAAIKVRRTNPDGPTQVRDVRAVMSNVEAGGQGPLGLMPKGRARLTDEEVRRRTTLLGPDTKGAKQFLALVLLCIREELPFAAEAGLVRRGVAVEDLGGPEVVVWFRERLREQEAVLRELAEVRHEARHD